MSKQVRISDEAHAYLVKRATKQARSLTAQLDRELLREPFTIEIPPLRTSDKYLEDTAQASGYKTCKNGHLYKGSKCTQKECVV